ncbi:hypothetical protein BH11MYX1_BH11MYX1_37300 [soil metagenome]
MLGIELVEVRDEVRGLGQLVELDLATADELEYDLAELGERFAPAAARERIVETGSTFPRTALEDIAESTGLGQRRAKQRPEGSSYFGRTEASTSLPGHVVRVAQLDYRRSAVNSRALVIACSLLAGCPPPARVAPLPIPPASSGKVRVRVFTEPSPVKEIGSAGRFLFVATEDSIQRWDENGSVMVMTGDHGLSGEKVIALAPDPDRKWLWVLTDAGLGHYDAQSEIYTELSPPPAAMNVDYAELARAGASLSAAAEGGVWLGTAKGLLFASDKGGWLSLPVKDPVRAVIRDHANWVWIATKQGLLARKPNGDVSKIGSSVGCDVTEPRILVAAPGDRVMAIGTDAEGHEKIAIGNKAGWVSYRALPELTWDAATREGDALMLMGGGRVYRISPAVANGAVRPLSRDGVRLVPTQSGLTSEWVIDPIDLVLPPSPTTLGATNDELLVGTRDLGTARYARGDAHPRDWFRRKQMFEDANTLSVACRTRNDCWIATGARQAWHWTGERLAAGGPDQIVLAVARDPSGVMYALHRVPNEKEIHMSRVEAMGPWTQVAKVALTTPGDIPEVSFTRFASASALWIGLRYRDGNERRAYGVAIVEPATGKVTYHRTEQAAQATSKMLPIPIGVLDGDLRGGTAWFATNEGVARLQNGNVRVWNEADGLRSELARAITVTQRGTQAGPQDGTQDGTQDDVVYVGTSAGAAVWDGNAWAFPPALQFAINDVVATHNGQVWMATERGIAAWDGKRVRRVDTRRGLAENSVLDVAADQFDRVWARGPGSLTLISQ